MTTQINQIDRNNSVHSAGHLHASAEASQRVERARKQDEKGSRDQLKRYSRKGVDLKGSKQNGLSENPLQAPLVKERAPVKGLLVKKPTVRSPLSNLPQPPQTETYFFPRANLQYYISEAISTMIQTGNIATEAGLDVQKNFFQSMSDTWKELAKRDADVSKNKAQEQWGAILGGVVAVVGSVGLMAWGSSKLGKNDSEMNDLDQEMTSLKANEADSSVAKIEKEMEENASEATTEVQKATSGTNELKKINESGQKTLEKVLQEKATGGDKDAETALNLYRKREGISTNPFDEDEAGAPSAVAPQDLSEEEAAALAKFEKPYQRENALAGIEGSTIAEKRMTIEKNYAEKLKAIREDTSLSPAEKSFQAKAEKATYNQEKATLDTYEQGNKNKITDVERKINQKERESKQINNKIQQFGNLPQGLNSVASAGGASIAASAGAGIAAARDTADAGKTQDQMLEGQYSQVANNWIQRVNSSVASLEQAMVANENVKQKV